MSNEASHYAKLDGILRRVRKVSVAGIETQLDVACEGDGRLLAEVKELMALASEESGMFAEERLVQLRRKLDRRLGQWEA